MKNQSVRRKGSEVTQAARVLGAKGGKVGGRARDDALSTASKVEIARKGGKARAIKAGQPLRK